MSGIEIAGLVLAAPGMVQMFFDIGEKIHKKMKNDKRTKDYARDLGKFLIDDGKAQVTRDLELAKGVLRDQTTRTDEKERISRVFNRALGQLKHIGSLVDIALGSELLWLRKRSMALKDLKDEVSDMRASLSEFHQLVMSLHTIATSEPLLLLEDQHFVLIGPEKDGDMLNATTCITRGRASSAVFPECPGNGRFILEAKHYTTYTMKPVKKDLRILSQKLAAASPDGGILPLLGFRDNPPRNEFQLVFSIPDGVGSIQTLDKAYSQAQPSLNFRIHLSSGLAEALLQTQRLGLVHKHIRPENILLLSTGDDAPPTVFLAGWQYARNVDGRVTKLIGESTWQRAIYQHPERQSDHVDNEYCMGHDIYSLGVCMLEILTWDPLAITTGDGDSQEVSMCQTYRATFALEELRNEEEEEKSDEERLMQNPQMVQRTLFRMAERLVPAAAGIRMRDLVWHCMTCLDEEATRGQFRISQERESKDVAIGFVDTVLRDIRRVMSVI